MRVQLRQLSREVVADAIAPHGRGDKASPGSQGAVALAIEIQKHVVVEKFAEAERNDGIHIDRERRCRKRIRAHEGEVRVFARKLARQLQRFRIEVEANEAHTLVVSGTVLAQDLSDLEQIARDTTGYGHYRHGLIGAVRRERGCRMTCVAWQEYGE